jgi:hypothetical protein
MTQDVTEGIKHVTDAISVLTVIGTLAQILPAIAAVFTIIWTGFRIYETDTVRSWLGKNNVKKN